ncbi:MAG: hypothetical protein AAGL98_02540 [Planctomycetota bacterium]
MKNSFLNRLAASFVLGASLLVGGCAGTTPGPTAEGLAGTEPLVVWAPPYFSTAGVLQRKPALDITGLTEIEIAEARAARVRAASVESSRLRERRRERIGR